MEFTTSIFMILKDMLALLLAKDHCITMFIKMAHITTFNTGIFWV